ncbi:MAG: UbiA prenyltransferase family protein, partial [Candidatus Parcubacteria bacterium]|nr:UbiA prenyltransferase family protein [Candidatus Parcubacteria bacterium]
MNFAQIKIFIQEMRIRQWIKNLLIFVPLIFVKALFNGHLLWLAVVAFLAFSLVASGVYVFNDLCDLKRDQNHPRKSTRPLAAGQIKPKTAKILLIVLLIVGLGLSLLVNSKLFWLLIFYILLNLAYSLKFKKVALIDLLVVAAMYLIRIYAGAIVISVAVSDWLLLTTLFGALLIVISKRRSELITNTNADAETRPVLLQCPTALLDNLLIISGATTLVFYALYTMMHPGAFVWSILFVIYILFRYLWLVLGQGKGEEPERLIIQDKPIFYALIGWLI